MSATHEGPIRHDAPWPRRSTTGWLSLWLVLALVAALTMPAAARGTPLRAGTLSAWGQNNHGLLGDGTTTNSTSPVAVTGLTDVVAVAGGDYHSLAVRRDGSVWAWGRNRAGQLGEGTATNSMLPIAVTGLSDAVEVAAGGTTAWQCAAAAPSPPGAATITDNWGTAPLPTRRSRSR
jgi:hypothetical protein